MKMAARLPKRKRASNGHEYMNDANDDKDGRYEQTTEDDRRKWTGWCEVESEPSFFNIMLRDMGIMGVKVQEIVSLDHDGLSSIPQPVFGLVFLFQWKEDTKEDTKVSNRDDIWFANQTVDNACATIALMNILYNIPSLDLGEHLHQFREFSKDLSSQLRGDALANFEFVRCIHNSFARRMEILNADLQMKNNVVTSTHRRRKQKHTASDAALHFNAFVPVNGSLWKLDGLESHPKCLGLVSDNWLEKLSADLTARMADYAEDQIQFVILGLVQDPVITIKKELAENIKSLLLVQTQLSTFAETLSTTSTTEDTSKENTDDSPFPALGDGTLLGTSPEYGVRGHDIDIATIDENIKTYIMEQDANSLFVYRDGLVQKQRMLRLSLRNELLSWQLDAEKASNRRHDYGPAVKKWLSSLYRVGFLREIMDNSHAKGLVV